MFALSKDGNNYGDAAIKEDLSDLFDMDMLANSESGFGNNGKFWIMFWTQARKRKSQEDIEIPFDETYTNESPSSDGFTYEEKVVSYYYYYSSSDVWYINTGSGTLEWGNQYSLTEGFSYSRAFIQWDIAGIPNNATITGVKIKVRGLAVTTANSQIRIFASKPISLTTEQIHSEAKSGTLTYESTTFPTVGSLVEYTLDSNSVSEIQNRITNGNWFALGITLETETGTSNTHLLYSKESTYDPQLIVEYTIPDSLGTEVGECEVGECEIA